MNCHGDECGWTDVVEEGFPGEVTLEQDLEE